MAQDIRRTIDDVFAALQAAALLADCCTAEKLDVPDIRGLAVERAREMMAAVEKARAGLTGGAPSGPSSTGP